MVDGARRLQLPRRKRIGNPISRASVITLSSTIPHLPTQRLSDAQKHDLILAMVARVAFAGFLRVGNLHTQPLTLETLKSSLLPS
jgi:hypothetical protein